MTSSHSPEELARLSTFVHNLLGWAYLPLNLALLVENLRGVSPGWRRYLWPGLSALFGVGLAVWIIFFQIYDHHVPPFSDPVQNQHQALGWVAGLGALVEMVRRSGRLRWAEAVWPISLVGIGLIFLVHEQHTLSAQLAHRAIAGTLALAGFAYLAPALAREEGRIMRVLGTLLLFAAAVQLIVYVEDPSAHGAPSAPEQGASPHEHQGH